MKIAIKEDTLIDQIDAYCLKTLKEWQVPGAAVAVVKDGVVIFEKGYGVKKYGENASVTPVDLFPIASLTKSFAASSIALLVDSGCLKWTDRVIDHLPDFKLLDSWVTREFQIIDLLTHRSGFYAEALEQMALWGYSAEDIKKGLAYVQPVTSFRSSYAYVNAPYLWIEDIVEKVSGQSWGEFVKNKIAKPLGMDQTGPFIKGQFMTGHILDEETKAKITSIRFSTFPSTFLAAGGLVSSVHDLSQWMLMQLGHKELVSKENRDYMHKPHTPIEAYIHYGVGWRILDDKPYRVVSHGGLIKGIKHRLLLVPEVDAGIVILTNLTDSEAPMAITDYFADCVMGINPKDYSQELKKGQEIKLPVKFEFSKKTFKNPILGKYKNPILGKVSIDLEEDDLIMTLGPKGAKARLCPFSENTFSLYFLGEAGAAVGEGHWGTATFQEDQMIMEGYESFEKERFILRKD